MKPGIVVIDSSYMSLNTDKYPMGDHVITRLTFCIVLLQLILAVVGLFVLIRYKKRLNIEKPGHNPLVLIYKVLKYAGNTRFLKIAVHSLTGKMTFLLALTLVRTSMEDHSLLRRWRTQNHSFVYSSFSSLSSAGMAVGCLLHQI